MRKPDFDPARLADVVFTQYLLPEVMSRLPTNDLKIAFQFMGLVRSIDATSMRRVLQVGAGELFAPWKQDDYQDLDARLRSTQLLIYDHRGKSLDIAYRRPIANHFRIHRPDDFDRINRVAIQMYEDNLARGADLPGLWVGEIIYHRATLGEPSLSLVNVLSGMKSNFDHIRDLAERSGKWEWLRDALAGDVELAELTNEVPAMLALVEQWRSEVR